MNTYRNITISMPNNIIKLLYTIVNKGKRSKFITETIKEKLLEKKLEENFNMVLETKKLQRKFAGTTQSKNIKSLIKKGRL